MKSMNWVIARDEAIFQLLFFDKQITSPDSYRDRNDNDFYFFMHLYKKNMKLKKCKKPEQFFNILPQDWQAGIVPFWEDYKQSATVYAIVMGKEIVAGGIVFTDLPPNPSQLDIDFEYLFDEGYQHIGFLFVKEEMRKHHLGSEWLELLKEKNPAQKFWLTIEEEPLKHFYLQNSFEIIGESDSEPKEWILVCKNKKRLS